MNTGLNILGFFYTCRKLGSLLKLGLNTLDLSLKLDLYYLHSTYP